MTKLLMVVFLLLFAQKAARAQMVAANAADLSNKLAPGSIGILVYAEFGVDREYEAAALPLPATLGGILVEVGGHPAPLFAVSPAQIKFQVPEAVSPGQVPIVVTRPDGNRLHGTAYVTRHGPAVFQVATSARSFNTVLVVAWTTGIQIEQCPHIQLQVGQRTFTPLFVGPTEYVGVQQLNFLVPRSLVTGIPNNNFLRVNEFNSVGVTLQLDQ